MVMMVMMVEVVMVMVVIKVVVTINVGNKEMHPMRDSKGGGGGEGGHLIDGGALFAVRGRFRSRYEFSHAFCHGGKNKPDDDTHRPFPSLLQSRPAK